MIFYMLISTLLFLPINQPLFAQMNINYSVIDGDSLKRDKKRYRLHGIDAPELKQLCWIDDQPWS